MFWSVLSYFFMGRFVAQSIQVAGTSMYPTLLDGNRHIVHRWPYVFGTPRRGDIVAVEVPRLGGERVVKRIVGLPNEMIELRHAGLFVNGTHCAELYLGGRAAGWRCYDCQLHFLGPDEYFVLGDNRSNSLDSRHFGPVHFETIIGRVSP